MVTDGSGGWNNSTLGSVDHSSSPTTSLRDDVTGLLDLTIAGHMRAHLIMGGIPPLASASSFQYFLKYRCKIILWSINHLGCKFV
jgi:hypothetical protein